MICENYTYIYNSKESNNIQKEILYRLSINKDNAIKALKKAKIVKTPIEVIIWKLS